MIIQRKISIIENEVRHVRFFLYSETQFDKEVPMFELDIHMSDDVHQEPTLTIYMVDQVNPEWFYDVTKELFKITFDLSKTVTPDTVQTLGGYPVKDISYKR